MKTNQRSSRATERTLLLIWICFLVRGLFYSSFLPLWEGYDEWDHFAHIARVAVGDWLPDRNEQVSLEISASLQLAPVPWQLRSYPPPSLTQDDYWHLPPEEQGERRQRLHALPRTWADERDPAGLRIGEALQPPLYYWLSALAYRLGRNAPLAGRVFLLRYLNVAIASLTIPLVFLAARRLLPGTAALGTAAFVSLLPEFLIDVCRVANDPLAIVLYSWLLLACFRLTDDSATLSRAFVTGVALGLGLLTKAYLLAAVPPILLIYVWLIWKSPRKRPQALRAVATIGVAILLAGWWYLRNRLSTGTWSGLSEAVMLRQSPWGRFLSGARVLPWGRALDSILTSHVWFGGWSALTVRSWMYHAVFLVAALGTVGVAVTFARRPALWRPLGILCAVYLCFWAAQAYNVLLLYLSKGAATSMGWYLYAVVAAEVILLSIGLREIAPQKLRALVIPTVTLLSALLDLYTVNLIAIPYYTGLIEHRGNGSLAAFHAAALQRTGLGELFSRLSMNKAAWLSPSTLLALWAAYLATTVMVVVLCSRLALRERFQSDTATSSR